MTAHPFDGHRVYDGCPDSTLQARLDAEQSLLDELRLVCPEAHATYFPLEECWQVHVWGRPLSGLRPSRMSAVQEALELETRR